MKLIAEDRNVAENYRSLSQQRIRAAASLKAAVTVRRRQRIVWLWRLLRYSPASLGFAWWVLGLVCGGFLSVGATAIFIEMGDPGFFAIILTCFFGFGFCEAFFWLLLRDWPGEDDSNRLSLRKSLLISAAKVLLEVNSGISSLRLQLDDLDQEISSLRRVLTSQVYRLLHASLDQLNPSEFEVYVGQIFRHLGFAVALNGGSGDQGVDVLAEKPGSRIAVQVKHWRDSVNNKAVQEAYTGKAHYRCNRCAVVTSSYFTEGAREIARSTGCVLIDRSSIPRLIRGGFDLG